MICINSQPISYPDQHYLLNAFKTASGSEDTTLSSFINLLVEPLRLFHPTVLLCVE
ncbi:hypothetical protein MNBD_GAMMA19-270 [hydrothermal vent metagenome]|uniref:Uncharacterized protein n=1 Tax=hydrothermal vent metagenome TaxID=652676 RepID=A0A3B0ZZ47_9ZZZZ